MKRPKVLYIAGWSRSGSTILGQVLGQAEGWFACGELRLLPLNFACGCGQPALECELWKPVLGETLPRHTPNGLEGMATLRRRAVGTDARTLAAIARGAQGPGRTSSAQRAFAALLADLYQALSLATGARVLVDSSKTVAEAYLIAALTGIDLYVVHLVRDPRASAYSWARRKLALRSGVYLSTMSPARSSINWLRRNLAIEAVLRSRRQGRYVRIRYEDFAAHPRSVARSLCSLLEDGDARLPFSDEGHVRLRPNHTVGGNPIRFRHGDLSIQPDEEWRTQMEVGPRLLATVPALPLMPRYGYPLDHSRGHHTTPASK